jgi:uncharacterized protein YndB with AHSA1/START domain
MSDLKKVTIEATVNAPAGKVWALFKGPEHIVKWNNASSDWHTTKSTNDLRVGGAFSSRMEAKDGSEGFDFEGTYDEVVPQALIAYTMTDGRKVRVTFEEKGGQTHITETLDTEAEHTPEQQRDGWQAILNSFKEYAEA